MRSFAKNQCGFTLIELVVVLLILGILAAIAAPRAFETSRTANDNGVRQTLGVIRSAIDTYAAEHNGILPGADGSDTTFKADMAGYLRGSELALCPVGTAKNNAIRMMSGNELPGTGGTVATHSWAYHFETGDFYVNSSEMSADKVTTYDKF